MLIDDYVKGKDKLLEALLHSEIDSQASDYDKDFFKKTRKVRASQNSTAINEPGVSSTIERKSNKDKFLSMPFPNFRGQSGNSKTQTPNFQVLNSSVI